MSWSITRSDSPRLGRSHPLDNPLLPSAENIVGLIARDSSHSSPELLNERRDVWPQDIYVKRYAKLTLSAAFGHYGHYFRGQDIDPDDLELTGRLAARPLRFLRNSS